MFALTQKLGEKVGLVTNLGIGWSGNGDNNPSGLYAVNLNTSLSKRISVFVENYGAIQDQELDTRFDTGLGYLINSNFQLDTSIGYGKNHGIEDFFIDFGFSWRTRKNFD